MPWSWALPGAVAGRKQASWEIEMREVGPDSVRTTRYVGETLAERANVPEVGVSSFIAGYEFAYRWAWREHLEAERWQLA